MSSFTILRLAFCILLVPSAFASDPDNCLLCHQFRGLSRLDHDNNRLHVYFVDPDYHRTLAGPHARLACTDCHERSEVSVVPHAPVSAVNCTRTCHLADPAGLERRFSHANVAETVARSVHAPSVLGKLDFTGDPLLREGQSQCLYCHDEPVFRGPTVRGVSLEPRGRRNLERCDTCHNEQIPTDIRYYLRHIASRLQPARSPLELAQVCAVCHNDPRIQERFELSSAVASYARSFHGKAALLGAEDTADCLDCHASSRADTHLLLAKNDPNSSVSPARVADSCSTIECHPGATPRFSTASVHLDVPRSGGSLEFLLAAAFIVITVATFGPSALLVILELLQIVVGRRHRGNEELLELTHRLQRDPQGRRRLIRFTTAQRIQHWILASLFTLLAVTGFPMKFADARWAATIIGWFGGLHNARLVHHWAGIALVIGFLAHLLHITWNVLRHSRSAGRPLAQSVFALPMWLALEDGRKALHLLMYLCFLRSDRPNFGRFSVKEKFEYIGVFWGTIILGVTGVVLWGEQTVSHFVSGRALNLALIAHTYEAFLAVIHVGILHVYAVMLAPHVFPLSPATLTGTTPTHELAENHGEFVRHVAREVGLKTEIGT